MNETVGRQNRLWTIAWLIAGLVIGAAYLNGGWIRQLSRYFGMFSAIFLVTAFVYAVARSSSPRPKLRLASGAMWMLLLATMIVMPVALRWTLLRWNAARLPLPPDAWAIRYHVDPIRHNEQEDCVTTCETALQLEEIERFYRQRLAAGDWSLWRREAADVAPAVLGYAV